MGVPKRLTEMQIRFAEIIVFGGPDGPVSGREAATIAGYSAKRATQEASELQNPKRFPLVVKYIGELRDEYQKKYAVTFERHIAELGKLRMEALKKGAWSAAINAEVARGKAAGLYIEQKIIRTGKIDDLSESELENRMKEIIDQYAPILEGVGTEDLKEKVKAKQKKIRLQPSTNKATESLKPLKIVKTDPDSTSNSSS